MKMTPLEIGNQSKLAQHVSTVLPTYQNDQVVIDTMHKLAGGGITKDAIKAALVWGQGPTVRVVELPDGTDGRFNKGMKSQIIFISTKVIEEFVKGNGQRQTKKGLVERVTITLLHEMTHWADDQDGKDADPTTEEGWEFEKAVFGSSGWNGKPPPGAGKRIPFLTGP